MNRYTKNQIVATFAVAFFILSVSLCVTVRDKRLYIKCYNTYIESVEKEQINGSDNTGDKFSLVEAELYHNNLRDDFKSLFKNKYDLINYELLRSNTEKLNHLKTYYRIAWIVALVSLITGSYAFYNLSKRRLYMPFLYGGILAAFLSSINAIRFFICRGGTLFALKNMILHRDYSYFDEGDVLLKLIPPEYAMYMARYYLFQVFLWIIIMVLVRRIIVNMGKPHKF